jgi:hypothetical protein
MVVKTHHNSVRVSEAALTAAAASRHALTAPNNMYKFQRHGPTDIHVEVRPREDFAATGKLDSQYVKHCRHSSEMLLFCSLVGDHSSGLLFDRLNTPINPIPCHPETVLAFMKYKTLPFGTPLIYNGNHVFDPATQEQAYCRGTWKCPTNVDSYRGMLKKYSALYPNDLQDSMGYTALCTSCVAEHELLSSESISLGLSGSCHKHKNNPRLVPLGDVTRTPIVSEEFVLLKARLKKAHERKGNYAITPSEFRKIRAHLMIGNKQENFTTYVMMLLGIKLFLRADEILSFSVEQFSEKMFQIGLIGSGSVSTLAAYICGKSDARPVLLNIFSDSRGDYEMDLVLHLLVYLKVTGITTGLLFPKSDSEPTEEIRYASFLKIMKKLLVGVLNKDPKQCCVGTHTLRKTAYLFGTYSMMSQHGSTYLNKDGKSIVVYC